MSGSCFRRRPNENRSTNPGTNRAVVGLLLLALLVTLAAACSQPSATPERAASESRAAPTPAAGAAQKWDTILAEARKEGTVSIYAVWAPETRTPLAQAFKNKYGINLEFSPFVRGSDLVAKVQTENRAGLYLADLFGPGNPTLLVSMKPEHLLASLKPVLLLPEVTDPKVWRTGKVPFTDEEGLALNLVGRVLRSTLYNVDMVKEGEITTLKDLLKPQFKDKITMNDPSILGAGNTLMTHVGHNLWGQEETLQFLKQLIRQQRVVMQRDHRTRMESVARGKYAIEVGASGSIVGEFLKLGAPIRMALLKEDTHVTASTGTLGAPTKFAHPNATIIFVNWLLTKEGQSVFATNFGQASTRVDASVEGIDPLFIPVPGEKYFPETEDFLNATGQWADLAKKVMDEAAK